MLGEAGHFSLEGGEVGGDAIDVKVNEGLLAFGTKEEVTVGVVVHEEVFGEDGGAVGMAEEVEGGFLVGVAVGVVGAETMRPARSRFWAYSRRRPSGLRLPLVSMPWPLSMRIFIAD